MSYLNARSQPCGDDLNLKLNLAGRVSGLLTLAVVLLLFSSSYAEAYGLRKGIKPAVDVNPDRQVFETYIEAAPHQLTLSSGETVMVFAYNGQLPGPEIRVKQGDRVIVHLTNNLPEGFPTTIHWHGIELNNASDGTPVTQDAVNPGESFTYDFIVPRAGIFWYHPHIRGSQEVIAGLYAPFIVTQPEERQLRRNRVLPVHEKTLVLSDISIVDGEVKDIEATPMLETMNGTEGEYLLVNGQEFPTIKAVSGKGLRLRLINASITRYYRLSLPGFDIYRVGGEGGLLPNVRLEGGNLMGMRMAMSPDYTGYTGMIEIDQGYERGEILLPPAARADVVIVPKVQKGKRKVKKGKHKRQKGTRLTVQWKDFARGRHMMVMTPEGMMMTEAADDGLRPSIDLFEIRLLGGNRKNTYDIAEGDGLVGSNDLLAPERTDSQIKLQADMMAMMSGMPKDSWFKIDGFSGVDGRVNYRTASVGETIQWETHNHTDMHHPFHLHGFSFQPVRFVTMHHDMGFMDMWSVNSENEYIDTVNVPPHTSVFYNFMVSDRPDYGEPVGSGFGGGASGDWVFHCHIFQHGENGMMSFLRVED